MMTASGEPDGAMQVPCAASGAVLSTASSAMSDVLQQTATVVS
jgi:hypothetical protein